MYYRTYARISLGAIEHNIEVLRRNIDKDVRIMAVVKADAYGSGASEVAPLIESEVDYFGVAALEEAIILRESGVRKPILVLAYSSPEQYPELIKYDITQTIYDTENARLLSEAAVRAGKTANVHIAVDTGMSRIGFEDNEKNALQIKEICSYDNLNVEGLFTHLARADEEDQSCSERQVRRFEKFVCMLENYGINIPVKHICNSAGTLNIKNKFNMVRLGILLYGIYPDNNLKRYGLELIPSMEIISHVVDIREIEPGVGVSYGHTFVAKKKMKLATVCIGYADGYPRALSDKGRVIINGRYANVIGRVCMDLMMVDITGFDDVSIGESVTIMGKNGEAEITAEEIASLTGTINYEIICSFKNRVKRVYEK